MAATGGGTGGGGLGGGAGGNDGGEGGGGVEVVMWEAVKEAPTAAAVMGRR